MFSVLFCLYHMLGRVLSAVFLCLGYKLHLFNSQTPIALHIRLLHANKNFLYLHILNIRHEVSSSV